MDAQEHSIALPRKQMIDYESLLHDARWQGASTVSHLCQHLPVKWRELYVAAVSHPTNIVRFSRRSFEYMIDLYSELEAIGEIPYDQTVEDRVVAVFGISAQPGQARGTRFGCWLMDTGELGSANRDKGHFIAHCIGGGLDVNVFSQDRHLNRGWSSQGKTYRQMERYCQEHPETFCFARPVYSDCSSVPRWLEFGLLREDATLWVEVFDNVPMLADRL